MWWPQARFDPFFRLWSALSDFNSKKEIWLSGPFTELEAESIEKDVGEWWTLSYRLMKELGDTDPGPAGVASQVRVKKIVHLRVLFGLLTGRRVRHSCVSRRRSSRSLCPAFRCVRVPRSSSRVKHLLTPASQALASPALKHRHWEAISEAIGVSLLLWRT